jgi:hypothetical protein
VQPKLLSQCECLVQSDLHRLDLEYLFVAAQRFQSVAKVNDAVFVHVDVQPLDHRPLLRSNSREEGEAICVGDDGILPDGVCNEAGAGVEDGKALDTDLVTSVRERWLFHWIQPSRAAGMQPERYSVVDADHMAAR